MVGEVSPPFRSGTWYLARSGLDEFEKHPKTLVSYEHVMFCYFLCLFILMTASQVDTFHVSNEMRNVEVLYPSFCWLTISLILKALTFSVVAKMIRLDKQLRALKAGTSWSPLSTDFSWLVGLDSLSFFLVDVWFCISMDVCDVRGLGKYIRFLCGWYDLYWFVSFESGCDQVVQTFPNPTSYQGQFFTDGCRLFGRSGLFISWLRASVFPVCYFVTGYRPWLCCQTLSRILFKGILYSWIAKSRSLWVKWSCSTVLGHSSKTCWISTRQRSVWAVWFVTAFASLLKLWMTMSLKV